MTEALICDYCGQSKPSENLIGWYRLDATNASLVQTHGGWEWPKHFCSLTCLHAFATEHMK